MNEKNAIPYIDLQANEKPVLIEAGQITSSERPLIKKSTPHRHDYQTVIWTASGNSTHLIDSHKIIMPTYSLCLIARAKP